MRSGVGGLERAMPELDGGTKPGCLIQLSSVGSQRSRTRHASTVTSSLLGKVPGIGSSTMKAASMRLALRQTGGNTRYSAAAPSALPPKVIAGGNESARG